MRGKTTLPKTLARLTTRIYYDVVMLANVALSVLACAVVTLSLLPLSVRADETEGGNQGVCGSGIVVIRYKIPTGTVIQLR